MAPLVGLFIKALIPVVVSKVQEKLADEKPHVYETPKDVPLSVAAAPAVKAAIVGTVKSKTGWFAIALGILGVLEINSQFISSVVPPQYQGWVIGGIGAISLFLRAVTTDSLVEKAESKE